MTTRSPFGSEYRTFEAGRAPDVEPTFTIVEGRETIVQAVLRSWLTPENTAPNNPKTCDIRSYAQMRLSSTARARCKRKLEAVARGDERVKACEVRVEPVARDVLRIRGRIVPRVGEPFDLVVDATTLSARLISVASVPT